MIFSYLHLLRPKDYDPDVKGRLTPICAQVKEDGIRCLIRKHASGMMDAYTRNGKSNHISYLLQHPTIKDQLKDLPSHTALDCELIVPGKTSSDVLTALQESDPALEVVPFAIPVIGGQDYTKQSLGFVNYTIKQFGFRHPQTYDFHVGTERALLSRAKQEKLEGWVLKAEHYRGWYKLKPSRTVDAVVTDVILSDSDTFAGGLKSLTVAVKRGTELVEIGQVPSGFDIEYRRSINQSNKRTLIGRVVEVEYDSLGVNTKMKFPRFLRWREDKSPAECTFDQLKLEDK